MSNQIIRENFIGTYNNTAPPVVLNQGDLVDGLNIRKISINGGWKGRKGGSLYKSSPFTEVLTGSFYGVATSSNGQIVAVTASSVGIYVSTDGGDSFSLFPISANLRHVAMSADGQHITAVTFSQKVYVSNDTGLTFVEKLTNKSWRGVAISSSGQYQIVVSYIGYPQVSSDYGATWVQRGFDAYWFGVATSNDSGLTTAVIDGGQIYTSTDLFTTWTARDSSRNWRYVSMSADGVYQSATVDNSGIFVSTNSGVNWTQTETSSEGWWDIKMSANGQYQTAVAYGTLPGPIKRSINYGSSWIATAEPPQFGQAVAIASDGEIQYYSVSNTSPVYKSYDYGNDFSQLLKTLSVTDLHWYKNPILQDQHFLAHVEDELYDMIGLPPLTYTSHDSIGSVGGAVGFSAVVNEDFFYASYNNNVYIWGGNGSNPLGFIIKNTSTLTLTDDTQLVRDNKGSTYALIFSGGNQEVYIISAYRLDEIALTLNEPFNTNSVTSTLYAWRGISGFVAVSSYSDGTASSGATLAKSGSLTWSRSANDALSQVSGIMGFVYKLTFSGSLSVNVKIASCFVSSSVIEPLTNKWSGVWEVVSGTRVFKNATGEYGEALGKVSVESTSTYIQLGTLGASDALYIKTVEPPSGFGIAIVAGFSNVNAVNIDNIEGWTGNAWASYTGLVDTTVNVSGYSLAQTGTLFFDGSSQLVRKRVLPGDSAPGYWTRITWDGTLSEEVRVFFLVSATYPEQLGLYDGCIEFKDRLILWGDKEYPNRLRFSATQRPDCFSGSNSGYTATFGDKSPILNVVKFYSELLVFKEKSVFLLEGDSPYNFGIAKITDTVGLASIHTAHVVEVGSPSMHRDEPLTIALWQDIDGMYALDGRKPRKISSPIHNFFDPGSPLAIPEEEIHTLTGFIDPINDEYHLLLSDKELVHNYITDEWYPPWERELLITNATHFIPDDSYGYVYASTQDNLIIRTEHGLNDKNTSNEDVAIEHYLTTRGILGVPSRTVSLRFNLRKLWAEFKAESVGSVIVKALKDLQSDAAPLVSPVPMSLVNSGFGMSIPILNINAVNCTCFQIKFYINTINWHMEIWSFSYEVDIMGEIGVG